MREMKARAIALLGPTLLLASSAAADVLTEDSVFAAVERYCRSERVCLKREAAHLDQVREVLDREAENVDYIDELLQACVERYYRRSGFSFRNLVHCVRAEVSAARRGLAPKRSAELYVDVVCGSKRYCEDMSSRLESYYHLEHCDLRRIDGDRDGIPCEYYEW